MGFDFAIMGFTSVQKVFNLRNSVFLGNLLLGDPFSEQSAQLGLIPTCRSVPVFSMFTEENISVVVGLDRPDEELEEARVELDLQRKVARKRTY